MTNSAGVRSLAIKFSKYLCNAIFVCCTYHCITEYFLDLAVCSGSSMEPTLNNKDVFIMRKVIFDTSNIKKGDILIVRNPTNPKRFWCKRLIGLPGDRISRGLFSGVVPRGHMWLEGDNSQESYDCRNIGPLPQGLILGKALYKLWPVMKNLRSEYN